MSVDSGSVCMSSLIVAIIMNKWSVAETSNTRMLSMIHVTDVAPFKWEMNKAPTGATRDKRPKFWSYVLFISPLNRNPWLGLTHSCVAASAQRLFHKQAIKTAHGHQHNISHTSTLCGPTCQLRWFLTPKGNSWILDKHMRIIANVFLWHKFKRVSSLTGRNSD